MLSFIIGCEDDNDPFSGDDNFITSFTLKQGDQVFVASFRGDTILLNMPENVSFSGLAAEVICSENTTIKPDPSMIDNWEQQMYFVVTSHSGVERKYMYIPSRSYFSAEGIIMLNTQEEVDAFGAKGYSRVDGSLIIGRQVGTDTITSLAALSSLKKVTENVVLNRYYLGNQFEGLDNLEEVGGSLQINSADSLWVVVMDNLTRVGGDFNITSASAAEVSCPKLQSVGGSLTLATPFVSSDFSALQSVSGNLSLNGKSTVQKMVFQSLDKVGGSVSVNMPVVRLEFPELISCDNLNVAKGSLLLLYCPNLQTIASALSILENPLYEITFPVLTRAGSINLTCTGVNQFNLPLLQSVDGDFSIATAGILSDNIASLESVGGTLTIKSSAERLQFPSSLKSLKTLVLANGIGEVDLRGVQIDELRFTGTGLETTTVIADDRFNGGIKLENLGGYMPKLQGFHEIEWLTISSLSLREGTVEINGIRKINGDFSYWVNYNIKPVSLSDLEEIGGNFKLYSSSVKEHFPKLTTIGGDATMSIDLYDEETFPLLATVGGNMIIQTGYSYYGDCGPLEILYPSLKQVGGTLDLRPLGPNVSSDNDDVNYKNTKWENLDFLSSLEKIGGLRIRKHDKLASFAAIKAAVLTCPEDKWQVEDNLYNPTYKQLVEEGQWTKPNIQE